MPSETSQDGASRPLWYRNQVPVPVLLSLARRDALDVRERLAHVTDPFLEPRRVLAPEGVHDVRQVRSIREIPPRLAGRARPAHVLARKDDALDSLAAEPPQPGRDGEPLLVLGQARQRGLVRAEAEGVVPPGALRQEHDLLRLFSPRDDLPPAARCVFARRVDDGLRGSPRLGEQSPLNDRGSCIRRLDPQRLRGDPQSSSDVDRHLVAAQIGVAVLETLAPLRGDAELDGKLEPPSLTHPGQVLGIRGTQWNPQPHVALNGRLDAHADEVSERCNDIQEVGLAARVRSDQDVERSERLRHLPQGPVAQRLDARHRAA